MEVKGKSRSLEAKVQRDEKPTVRGKSAEGCAEVVEAKRVAAATAEAARSRFEPLQVVKPTCQAEEAALEAEVTSLVL